MMLDWLVYAWIVSGLMGVAAWLAERGARAQRWPTRWVWAAALMLSLTIPLMAWRLPAGPTSSLTPSMVEAAGEYVVSAVPALGAVTSGSAGPSMLTVALAAWGVVSVLLAVLLVVLGVRLWARHRTWPARKVDGVEVLVSTATGPAAIGVLRGRVVVPEWALALDPARRRLLVLHEAEHVRARDPQLALVALIVCVLVPWNLPLWWQLRRLRLAVEVDCDARVLRSRIDPRLYGSLLLDVGQRRVRLALALTEPRTMLERRIRMIAMNGTGRATRRAVGLAAVSGLVLAVACTAPRPEPVTPRPASIPAPEAPETEQPRPAPTPPADIDRPEPTMEELAERPTFTPMTEPPRLKNADDVSALLKERYPAELRESGIGGTTKVWFFIDASGAVQRALVNETSGYEVMDAAALDVAEAMEFSPAYNREEPVPVWVAIDLTFEPQP